MYAGTGGGVFRSADKGATWTAASQGLTTQYVRSLAPSADGTLYAGTYGGGVFRSTDKGATWMATNQGLTTQNVKALAPSANGTLYAGTYSGGVFRSTDKGATWTAASQGLTILGTTSLALGTEDTLYAGTDDGVFRSTDKGANWTAASQGLTNQNVHSLALGADGTLFAGTNDRVFRSADKGATWTAAGQGIENPATQSLVLGADGTLYAGTLGGVFRSTDKGANWTAASQGLTNKEVWTLALGADGTVYAGTWGGGVFRSADKSATWTAASQGLTNQDVRSLALGADGTLYAGTSGGLFRSTDKGATWTAANQGLGNQSVISLALGTDGILYAGTDGGSVQRLATTTSAKLATLTLLGANEINETATTTLRAEAAYDSGAKSLVTPTWKTNNPAASIAADGTLTALAVDKDTPLTVTATYSEGGITQTATRQVVIRNQPAKLTKLAVNGETSLPSGGSINLSATALFDDKSSAVVTPQWKIASGPASIATDGTLTAQTVSADTPVTVAATFSDGKTSQSASLTLTVKKAAAKLKEVWIFGPSNLTGGQTARYSARAVYEDGSQIPVSPVWTSRDPASPVRADGTVQFANATRSVQLVANYNDASGGAAGQFTAYVTQASGKANTLKVMVDQVADLSPGDRLTVDISKENFDPLTRYDLYAAVQAPGLPLIFLNDSGDIFGLPSFMGQLSPYRVNTSLVTERSPLLYMTLPKGLPKGSYTFQAVAVPPGADVMDASRWLAQGAATVKVGQ